MKRSIGAIFMAVGIALSGYFIYLGISKYAEKDRCVTVKGLSEREVLANRVTWPMKVSINGNNLDNMRLRVTEMKDTVIAYLKQKKINDANITVSALQIDDRWEYNEVNTKKERYNVSIDITVTSDDVPLILSIMKNQTEFLKKGVCLTSKDYGIKYEYTDLAKLKPSMVEEATKNAHAVAEKFAEDANCEIGSIINATQGQFSIDEEYYRPQYMKIRVVTTVAYYLK
ncbi:MAG: SIMPL domain-containing protein [Prevotellaceae bacterium]|nr:SIMPL domain-containing protein [Candidatus Minthosoma caballi]